MYIYPTLFTLLVHWSVPNLMLKMKYRFLSTWLSRGQVKKSLHYHDFLYWFFFISPNVSSNRKKYCFFLTKCNFIIKPLALTIEKSGLSSTKPNICSYSVGQLAFRKACFISDIILYMHIQQHGMRNTSPWGRTHCLLGSLWEYCRYNVTYGNRNKWKIFFFSKEN